ncbi:hypothetical protein DICPUDRAFT_95208 [Dictyostelium purpureum]|uniref:Carbohydrate binding domain-containing protein n=1 Tax=Dictyostelium purpureum TaxID=5786 RepID=F0ZTK9_DICPU|nr:uncharacterized protein DICPUDRAFT_95208 [Dictyostelium purpureum]EGC32715.1 hypothetical protein DICPUDRAFT_95208 [Dictyostelium purpureum]|eukprot:XP_003290748.1 hypothetical protein DICPUDRAFT_95208 [Dictyostelium purpureum]
MKLLFTLLIGFLGFVLAANALCSKGIDQKIYDDQLGYTVADWSWAKPRNFTCTKPVRSGIHSIAFFPKTYDGLYFNLQNPIDPSIISFVSFWVHGNKAGGQKVLVRFTLNKVAVSRDFYLYGQDSIVANTTNGNILPGCWSQAIINTDHLEPGQYDGIQILSSGEEVQELMYIDDIEVHKRCDNTPYRNIMKPEVCDGHDCVSVAVKEGEKNWIQNGIEYQQYVNSMVVGSNQEMPKDIWNVSYLEGGFYGLPDHIELVYPGQEYQFGCVSVKGPVSFKISYVEYENEKGHAIAAKPAKSVEAAAAKPAAKTATEAKPAAKPAAAKPATKATATTPAKKN